MPTDWEKLHSELVAVIKELDKTRPVTAGLASALMSNETGYADALDVAGYNYQEFRYEPDHKKYPKRPLIRQRKRDDPGNVELCGR